MLVMISLEHIHCMYYTGKSLRVENATICHITLLSFYSRHSQTSYALAYKRVYTLENVCCDGFQGTPPNCYCELRVDYN